MQSRRTSEGGIWIMKQNGNVLLRECEPFFHMSHDELLQKAVELQREVNILKSENLDLREIIRIMEDR